MAIYKTIYLEKKEGIATITLLQPSLNPQMSIELKDTCQEIKEDKGIRVVILTGGDDFCCGGGEGKPARD